MRTYTYDETLAELRKIVAEKGEDFVYYGNPDDQDDISCYYVKDGQPDCIVGHLLVNLGVELELLDHNDGIGQGFARTVLADLKNYVSFDEKTVSLLAAAQIYQDRHETWGESLQKAVKYAETL